MSLQSDRKRFEAKQRRATKDLQKRLNNVLRAEKACDQAEDRWIHANNALAEFEADCDGEKGEPDANSN